MLNEIKDVTQYETGKHRRWFHDDYFDLYTWETPDGTLQGFQLCYAKASKERALRWSPEAGYSHEGVEYAVGHKQSTHAASWLVFRCVDALVGVTGLW